MLGGSLRLGSPQPSPEGMRPLSQGMGQPILSLRWFQGIGTFVTVSQLLA